MPAKGSRVFWFILKSVRHYRGLEVFLIPLTTTTGDGLGCGVKVESGYSVVTIGSRVRPLEVSRDSDEVHPLSQVTTSTAEGNRAVIEGTVIPIDDAGPMPDKESALREVVGVSAKPVNEHSDHFAISR